MFTHADISRKWWSDSSKSPWYHPLPLKEMTVPRLLSILPPPCPCDVFGTLLFLTWNRVTLGENYYFPSGEGNLLLGKELKLASGGKYLRKRRVSFTPSSFQLPSSDRFQPLYSNFPLSGPLPMAFTQHPSPPSSPLAPPSSPVPRTISPGSC